MQSLAVLLLHARHPYPAQHGGVASVMRQQRTHHLLRVDPVCVLCCFAFLFTRRLAGGEDAAWATTMSGRGLQNPTQLR